MCGILNVTPSAVSRMVARGVLSPAVKAPGDKGAFMFSERAVRALQEKRASESAEPAQIAAS